MQMRSEYYSSEKYIGERFDKFLINSNGKLINRSKKHVELKLKKDSVYLINFTFINCAPCRDKMNALNEISNLISDTNFKIIHIHEIEDVNEFVEYYKDEEIEIYHDIGGLLSKKLNLDAGYPVEFIISKNGEIVSTFVGLDNENYWNYIDDRVSLINKLLNE